MKKLEKLSLKQMEQEMPVIGGDKRRKIIGGSDVVWYTQEELDKWVTFGNWTGGYVEGIGYVGPCTTVEGSDPNGPYGQDYIDLTAEEKFMKAYGEGLRDAAQFAALLGIAITDVYLLISTSFPSIGPDIMGPGSTSSDGSDSTSPSDSGWQ